MRDDLKTLLGLCCSLAAAFTSMPAMGQQQEQLGRLFFTPAQRSSLDVARSQRARATLSTEGTAEEQQAAPVAQSVTYGGVVRRSDGKSTVWLNGRPVEDRELATNASIVGRVRADGSVTLQIPQSGRSVDLKPGQSVELLSGTIEEGYTRKPPAAPEAKPEAKPAAADKKGKPSAEEIAKTDREREDREQQRLEDALRAVQDAGNLKPAPRPAPSAEGPPR